ncbi:hypothetical protein [Vibrio splendidus]|uniref:hypothetical protein n=1 Tax=Vibrio splendidus TaxID=29497 RepID=UPI000E08F8D9|nr:hypothetical protein [Vibrio splendidus]
MIKFNIPHNPNFVRAYKVDVIEKTKVKMSKFLTIVPSGYKRKFKKVFTEAYIEEIILSPPEMLIDKINHIYTELPVLSDYYYPEFIFKNISIPNDIEDIKVQKSQDQARVIGIKATALSELRSLRGTYNTPLLNLAIHKLSKLEAPKDIRDYLQRIYKFKNGNYSLNEKEKKQRLSWIECFGGIFDYDSMSSNYGFTITENLDIHVCLYCNNEKIQIIKGRKNVRPDLDHFYPKSKFPFLSVSLSNLVPSGNICNQDFKKSKDMLNHVHPFVHGIDDSRLFRIITPAGQPLKEDNVKIQIIKQNPYFDNNIETFELESVYNCDDELKTWLEATCSKSEFLRNIKGNFQRNFREDKQYKIYVDLTKKAYKVTAQKFKIDAINQFTGKDLVLP